MDGPIQTNSGITGLRLRYPQMKEGSQGIQMVLLGDQIMGMVMEDHQIDIQKTITMAILTNAQVIRDHQMDIPMILMGIVQDTQAGLDPEMVVQDTQDPHTAIQMNVNHLIIITHLVVQADLEILTRAKTRFVLKEFHRGSLEQSLQNDNNI